MTKDVEVAVDKVIENLSVKVVKSSLLGDLPGNGINQD